MSKLMKLFDFLSDWSKIYPHLLLYQGFEVCNVRCFVVIRMFEIYVFAPIDVPYPTLWKLHFLSRTWGHCGSIHTIIVIQSSLEFTVNKRKLTVCFISLNIRHYIMLMTKRYLSDLIEYIKRDVLENRSLLAKILWPNSWKSTAQIDISAIFV